MTQYPGPNPDDPFSQPPNESGDQSGTPEDQPATPPAAAADHPADQPTEQPTGIEETAPIQREEMGYWEKKALEDQARLQQEANQQASSPDPQQQPPSAPSDAPPAGPTAGPQDPPSYQAPPPQDPLQAYGGTGGYGQYQQPQQPYGQQQPYGGQQPYGQQYAGYTGYQVQKHPQSTTALVLGLVGLIGGCLCGLPLLVCPFAWAISARVKREIAASNGQLGGEGNAQAGFIMGIIGTVLLVIVVIGVIGLLAVGFATDGSSTVPSQY